MKGGETMANSHPICHPDYVEVITVCKFSKDICKGNGTFERVVDKVTGDICSKDKLVDCGCRG
jgi:hypothetical protein